MLSMFFIKSTANKMYKRRKIGALAAIAKNVNYFGLATTHVEIASTSTMVNVIIHSFWQHLYRNINISPETLAEVVLPVRHHGTPTAVLQGCEVEKMRRSVDFVVKLFRIGKLQVVLHVGIMTDTCS